MAGPLRRTHITPTLDFESHFTAPLIPQILITPLASPSILVNDKHILQLETYQRQPRHPKTWSEWLSSPSYGFPCRTSVSRKSSGTGEEGAEEKEDEQGKQKKRNLNLSPPQLKKDLKGPALCTLGLFLFVLLVSPLLSQTPDMIPGVEAYGTTPPPVVIVDNSTLPLVVVPKPRPSARKSHHHRLTTRVTLPQAVDDHATHSHPVSGGLLQVDLDSGLHPVHQLIRDARDEWDDKVARQSTTLKQAVHEYTRRNHRAPPKGFDKWWNYVCENNVPLPDEYDQISRDLLPFRAFSPSDLRGRLARATKERDTYTLSVRSGKLHTSHNYGDIAGAGARKDGQVDLMAPIVEHLGDMDITYTVHDTPSRLISWNYQSELVDRVQDNEYVNQDDDVDRFARGWSAICPPQSALRKRSTFAAAPPPFDLSSKSFISSHAQVMDPCSHPSLVPFHSLLAGKEPGTTDLLPLFSISKTTMHADILGVPTEQFSVGNLTLGHTLWSEKKDARAVWRGSNTGSHYAVDTPWRESQRIRLLRLASKGRDAAPSSDAKTVSILPGPSDLHGSLRTDAHQMSWEDANKNYLDVAFTGTPIQCDKGDGTCSELADEFEFGKMMSFTEASNYKYVLDIDGNAWSARFRRLLSSGSLIFKSTIMPEWWTERIQPWVHYVPVQLDYSDLYDSLTFFKGEDGLAREIAEAGKAWTTSTYRKQDMVAYVFRLYLEWARLIAPVRANMDFVYSPSMERTRTTITTE